VRRWRRRATSEQLHWLHRRGAERLVVVREAFYTIQLVRHPLGDTLCALSAAASKIVAASGFPIRHGT
jgi:hypothetical protein